MSGVDFGDILDPCEEALLHAVPPFNDNANAARLEHAEPE